MTHSGLLCKVCGRRVRAVQLDDGRLIRVDLHPAPEGRLAALRGGGGTPAFVGGVFLARDEPIPAWVQARFNPHSDTCRRSARGVDE